MGTSEPSIEMITVLTPRPTESMGDLTPRPTQNSFDFDFVGNTLSPVVDEAASNTISPAPSSSDMIQTPFPTSNGELLEETTCRKFYYQI